MNNGPLIFFGIFLSLALSWLGLVVANNMDADFGGLGPHMDETTGMAVPEQMPGLARQGQRVYQDLGCATCHTQQVRREGFGADVERGWGTRQSVARDYIHQSRVMVGSLRIGPDLMNVGDRLPLTEWHHHHLYDPQINTPGSIMPSHAFLYETRKVMGTPSPFKVRLPGVHAPPDGYEVVPTSRADALVAYLLSLKTPYDLPEARSSHE
jgi:cytochrome c oxidase cbb3-type subunit 2